MIWDKLTYKLNLIIRNMKQLLSYVLELEFGIWVSLTIRIVDFHRIKIKSYVSWSCKLVLSEC